MFASLRKMFTARTARPATIAELPPIQSAQKLEEPILISQDMMDAVFDRSAGRWCDVCEVHGSHHTDRHNEFAIVAQEYVPW